jgi:hypothetical protein
LVKRGVKRQVITPIDVPEQFSNGGHSGTARMQGRPGHAANSHIGAGAHWQKLLDDGKVQTIADIARMEDIDVTQVRQLLRLVLLAPTLVETIVVSNEQMPIKLDFVLRRAMPANWQEQGALFAQRH